MSPRPAMSSLRAAWIWPAEIPLHSGMYRYFGRGTFKGRQRPWETTPGGCDIIAELAFFRSVMVIIFGAFFGMFGNAPVACNHLSDRFCLWIFSAYFQDN